MVNKKNDDYYISRVIVDLKFIIDHTDGKTQKDIESDELLKDSILFRVIRISENTDKLTTKFKLSHKDIPWSSINRLGNIIEHNYDDLDLKLFYETVFNVIPNIYEKVNDVYHYSRTLHEHAKKYTIYQKLIAPEEFFVPMEG